MHNRRIFNWRGRPKTLTNTLRPRTTEEKEIKRIGDTKHIHRTVTVDHYKDPCVNSIFLLSEREREEREELTRCLPV
jgi:hypothetical protein